MGKMSKKQWFVLWLFFVVYWFLGATLFYTIEHPLERDRRAVERAERNQLHELLLEHYGGGSGGKLLDELLARLEDYCQKPFSKVDNATYDDENDEENPYKWSFYNSVFFSLITASTVGYGNVSPFSAQGKILVIFYSLFGIPYFGIVVTQLGEFFSSIFVKAHHKYKAQVYETRTALVLDILKYLIPGVFVFIVAPAGLISHMENWHIVTAVYYTYVTLTTIGYGDFVAGHLGDLSAGYAVYKAALLFWIMFGLGYLIMILGFISRAMKSKRVRRLEQKLAGRIKQTQSRIWREFVSDVSYVRRLLNEMYLLKVKPVYKEGLPVRKEGLSQSCPDLSDLGEAEEGGGSWGRRRAFSESAQAHQPTRVMSEGQLARVDRVATFGQASLEPAAFLASVADALEADGEEDPPVEGIDMFSDEEILASEGGGGLGWTMGGEAIPGVDGTRCWRRRRALSEATAGSPRYILPQDQKTWTSADAPSLHQWALMKNTFSLNNGDVGKMESSVDKGGLSPPQPKGLRRVSLAALNFITGNRLGNKTKPEDRKSTTEHRLSLQESNHNRLMQDLNYNTTEANDERRPSLLEALGSAGNGPNISPILEQTSLADFIRVMASIRRHQIVTDEPNLSGRRRRSSPGLSGNTLSNLFANQAPLPRQLSRLKDQGAISSTKSLAMRRSSLSPIEILQRRRFSQVPNVSSSTLSSDDGVFLPAAVRRRAASGPRSSFRLPSLLVTTPEGRPSSPHTLVEEESKGSDESLEQIVVRL